MAANLLEDWCRGMEADIHRSLLVTGIPEDCGQAEIEETLNGVLSPLGPFSVLNKIFLREENAKAALIEVGEGVNLRAIPREFPGRGGIWRVVCRDPTQDAEFLKNLNEFLDAEERTLEDVVRLLELSRASPPQTQNRSPENWAEALGVLLGAVMQIIYYMDAEMRSQEEVRAQELAEAQAVASWASTAGRKVEKEPGRAAERGSALKMENLDGWNDVADGGDAPKPLVQKAGVLTRSRRKKQKNTPKQEPVPWKKSQGSHSHSSASLKHPEADGGKNREMLECVRNNKKPCVKREGSALKKPPVKCAWKFPSNPPRVAASRAVASESDQDGGLEGPPKKKAMGWASAKSPAHMRKQKKVSLGPVSCVLVDSEDPRKKPEVSKKGPGSSRDAPDQKAPGDPQSHESPTSASQGPEAKPQGPPHASSAENDGRNRLGCVNKWMEWEEQQWKVGAQEPKGAESQMVGEDLSAVEEAGDPPIEASETENPDPPPRSP
ncbi:paraneoplastic antigen-like protein 8A [Moschus berezovskii]|uniref:paraneoplastic antigen-like protein 8A n=1 Tax=Moschus berezovskii TaxID=68408 RepID=UPI002444E062|nr:paraneoplastic antigen-like protein 8A [Moschus berezovskii]